MVDLSLDSLILYQLHTLVPGGRLDRLIIPSLLGDPDAAPTEGTAVEVALPTTLADDVTFATF